MLYIYSNNSEDFTHSVRIVTCKTEKIKSGTGNRGTAFQAVNIGRMPLPHKKAVPPYTAKEYIPLTTTDI